MRTAFRDQWAGRSQHRAARGFTLVELMVVIGIIGLLVAIALPALNAARRSAKRAATEATLSVLGTGVEQFHSDSAIGGAYPPSVRVGDGNTGGTLFSPYTGGKIEVSGANLLVWALAGADLLGSPGFRNLDNVSDDDYFGGWLSDTHRGNGGMYQINPNTGKPVVSRSAAYVDLSKVRLTKQVGNGAFQAPAAANFSMTSHAFLDNFDQPILYYRANPNAPGMVASGTKAVNPINGNVANGDEKEYNIVNQRYTPTGIYNLRDNSLITGNGGGTEGIDFGAGKDHPLRQLATGYDANARMPVPRGSFAQHLWNPNITAVLKPQREDSFILLSAGDDGLFGTADDVANFPLNK